MVKEALGGSKIRNIGNYFRSGKWDDYWQTKISHAMEGRILVRGYPINELIENLSFVELTYLIIRGELPTWKQAAGLDLVLRSGADQQFINSSIPPARFTASAAPESPVAAIASGILAFGSVTGSPQECAEMIYEAHDLMKRENLTLEETAMRIVDQYQKRGKRIPGIGHPMHKKEEPRVTSLKKKAKQLGLWGEKSEILEAVQAQVAKIHRPLPMNLAGAIACLLTELGFDPLEMSGIAVIGYLPALIAHTVEEIKEGVPLRIIPDSLGAKYVGPEERHLPSSYLKKD
jgi:citrate synthase